MTRNSHSRSRQDRWQDDDWGLGDTGGARSDRYRHKTGQLCAQVQRILGFQLAAETTADCLQGFYVDQVLPDPGPARLLVVLRRWDYRQVPELGEVMAGLKAAKGPWRAEIGRAINRKRIPDLAFQVLYGEARDE